MNLNEYLYQWCVDEFPRQAQKVYDGFIEVFAGNRLPNTFEKEAIRIIKIGYYCQKMAADDGLWEKFLAHIEPHYLEFEEMWDFDNKAQGKEREEWARAYWRVQDEFGTWNPTWLWGE